MRSVNLAKLDAKGRVLIPAHLRKMLHAEEGSDIMIIPDEENSVVRLLPISKTKTAEFHFKMQDHLGNMAQIMTLLQKYNVSVLMSESRSLARDGLTEWTLIADVSRCNGYLERLKDQLVKSETVQHFELLRTGEKL